MSCWLWRCCFCRLPDTDSTTTPHHTTALTIPRPQSLPDAFPRLTVNFLFNIAILACVSASLKCVYHRSATKRCFLSAHTREAQVFGRADWLFRIVSSLFSIDLGPILRFKSCICIASLYLRIRTGFIDNTANTTPTIDDSRRIHFLLRSYKHILRNYHNELLLISFFHYTSPPPPRPAGRPYSAHHASPFYRAEYDF